VVIDGDDLPGDAVNTRRLEGTRSPAASRFPRTPGASDKLPEALSISRTDAKNIARPVRVFRIGRADGRAPPPALPDKPSIAVLPFANMSGDAEQEYFSDGMVEDHRPVRINWLFRSPELELR
jgi:adenylate cyclase